MTPLTTTPLLKYAGGKRKLASRIVDMFGITDDLSGRAYHEPFAGGAAVFLEMRARFGDWGFQATLGDTCVDLMKCYASVKTEPRLVAEELSHMVGEYLGAEDRDRYYKETRAWFNAPGPCPKDCAEPDHIRAAVFLFLNRTCFNGLWRQNRKGEFNVPHGRYKKPAFPTERLDEFAARLKNTYLYTGSYTTTMCYVRDKDLVYLDCPYDTETSQFTTYSGQFTWEDQVKLVGLAANAAERGARVIASNRATSRMLKLYHDHGFKTELVNVQHSVGATGDRRSRVTEVLACR